jgi:hypothetical protein
MDLAALLSLAEAASDEGASVIVCPRLPGLGGDTRIYQAFIENMRNHAPGSLVLMPSVAGSRDSATQPFMTPLGRTAAFLGDECIEAAGSDPGRSEAMVWQPDAESPIQAEAFLELALDSSLSIAGLVLVSAVSGRARGQAGFGGSAIVHLGDILAEAGEGEDVVSADVDVPVSLPERPGPRPVPPPILAQRLAHHRGDRPPSVDYPADLS